ncbi:MAG: phenylalanine--tRNA ligase subunit beta [Bacteroidales bacterium]|nr:phenylalanine--tRNA ligase subunit beta [Bacteroidales bacterium]
MKLSYNWLKDYLKCDLTPSQVAEAMTSIGIEVDSVETVEQIPGGLAGVVVAEVLTCIPHPDSDHLHITTVNDGTPEPLTVVCGAPNVAAGQKVLFARIGTVLPGDFKIKKSKIRGVESFGMICAEDELGIGSSHEGIMVLPGEAVVGTPAKEYLGLGEEAVIEYEITANRIDASSHIGVARDLYAYLRSRDLPARLEIPSVSSFCEGPGESIPVELAAPDGAPHYTGITIRGVKVAPSPSWLQEKLLSIGLRPINNIVDISNFVLFEIGAPLHTFDADKIRGGRVIVRRAAEGEKIVTLDGLTRTLCDRDMVIADAEGPMCLAGVFGGEDSGVTDSTVNVFIESAWFDPASIRRTAKKEQLSTDASFRFERGADPGAVYYAGRRAALLIQEIAGGEVVGKVRDECGKPYAKALIDIDFDRIERFAGKKLGHATINKILDALDYEVLDRDGSKALVSPPSYMVDVYRECDVVEEILRIYGYDNIELPSRIRMSVSSPDTPEPEALRNAISNFFASLGFNETMNNSLTKGAYYDALQTFPAERCVRIVNPLSTDLNVLRQTLILSGLEVVAYNANRQAGYLRTFEYGSVYQRLPEKGGETLEGYEEHQCFCLMLSGAPEKVWRAPAAKSNFFELKGYVELLLRRYRIDPAMLVADAAPSDIFSEGVVWSLPGSGKQLVCFGTVNQKLCRSFGVKQPVFAAEISWQVLLELIRRDKFSFRELPRFPEVRRDLALLLDEAVAYSDLRRASFKAAKKLLRSVSLFDVYRGDKIPAGKKQYALNFVLQDTERTLTDADVEGAMTKILSALQNEFGAQLR